MKLEREKCMSSIFCLNAGNYAIEVLPAYGFSLVSFKHAGIELLDCWDLARFKGNSEDLASASKAPGPVFRKGFGPSIGPWFGGRFPGDNAFNHGVCRFADWSANLETGPGFIRSRLNGSREWLLDESLDEICGFHLDVEITYTLSEKGLSYSMENRSEGKKGTYGVHWYFMNPAGTRALMNVAPGRLLPDGKKEPLDPAFFSEEGGKTAASLSFQGAYYLENRFPIGPDETHAELHYPDGGRLSFRCSEAFFMTVLFCSGKFVCVEPVSGLPFRIGTFDKGTLTIVYSNPEQGAL